MPRRRAAARGARRRVLVGRASREGLRVRQADDRAAEGADPPSDVRRGDPGRDRLEDDRARDREGQAQGRAGQVLRGRHHPQAQAPGGTEEGEGADAARRQGRRAAGGVHRRAAGRRGGRSDERREADLRPRAVLPDAVRVLRLQRVRGDGRPEAPVPARAVGGRRRWSRPAGAGVGFASVFLGGGTPTTMEPSDLGALLDAPACVVRRAAGRRGHDRGEPGHGGRGLAVERSALAGFSRLSMGAQSFDPEVLAALERVHSPDSCARRVRRRTRRRLRQRESGPDLRGGRRDDRVVGANAPRDDRARRPSTSALTRSRSSRRRRSGGRSPPGSMPEPDPDLQADMFERRLRAAGRSRIPPLRGLELGQAGVRVPP